MTCDPQDIAALEEALAAGVRQSSMDGQTVTIDLDFLQRRVRELRARDLTSQVNGCVRPTVMRANFGRMFNGIAGTGVDR